MATEPVGEEAKRKRREVRLFVQTYHSIQELRIKLGGRRMAKDKKTGLVVPKYSGRLGSLMKELGFTEQAAETMHSGITGPIKEAEEYAKKKIEEWVVKQPLWGWLEKIPGIGPVFSGGLLALVDIERASTVSKLWSYLGQDVRKYGVIHKGDRAVYRQWFASEDDRQIWIERQVKNQQTFYEAMKADGKLKGKGKIEKLLKRDRSSYMTGTCAGEGDWTVVSSAPRRISRMKINWSPIGRKTCWLIGESFVKQKADGCLYRRVYDDAKDMYMARLEAEKLEGLAEDEALAAQEMSSEEETDQETPEQEELPEGEDRVKEPSGLKGIAHRRAKRKAVKLFISHVWEISRRLAGLPIRRAYVIEKLGHSSVIEPPHAENIPSPIMFHEEDKAA